VLVRREWSKIAGLDIEGRLKQRWTM